MSKEQYENTSKDIARVLIESNLDMDYMDFADSVESELQGLENEIESIRESHIYLSHALDLFATMQGLETPLIDSMIEFHNS